MKESHNDWFHRGSEFSGCALGLAIAGKLGTDAGYAAYLKDLIKNEGNQIKTVAEILEIQMELASAINELHMMEVSATEIAECLEFEKGED
jgi:hypothetical protein